MRRFSHTDNLVLLETPKERVRRLFWDALFMGVGCALAWDMAAYGIRGWESGTVAGFVTAGVLALALGWLIRLGVRARSYWWPLAPVFVAFCVPIVLHVLES